MPLTSPLAPLLVLIATHPVTPSPQLDQTLVGKWAPGPPLVTGRLFFGLASVGTRLYAVSGGTDTADAAAVTTVEVLETAAGAGNWTAAPHLTTARFDVSVAAVGAKLYAVGGQDTGGRSLNSVEVLDTTGGGWTPGPPLNTPRFGHGLAAMGSKLYAVGGAFINTVEVLDTSGGGGWTPGPPLATGRDDIRLAVLGSKIYAVGGYTASQGPVVNTVEVLDTASGGGWVAGPPLATPRRALGLAFVGTTLYAVGGACAIVAGVKGDNSVEMLDTTGGGGWTPGPPLITGRCYLGAASIGNTLYAVGGCSGGTSSLASVEMLGQQLYECIDEAVCMKSTNQSAVPFDQCNTTCHPPRRDWP